MDYFGTIKTAVENAAAVGQIAVADPMVDKVAKGQISTQQEKLRDCNAVSKPVLSEFREEPYSGIQECVLPEVSNTPGISAAAEAVDYGSIPLEHQWRYDRYLNGPSENKLGPGAWYNRAQTAWANTSSGNAFEQSVRERLGAPLGVGSKPIIIGGYIPDLPVGAKYGVTDVKDWIALTDSDQLRAFHAHALKNDLPFNLIIGPRTRSISEPLLDNIRTTGGSVKVFDPETGKFQLLDIGNKGFWKRHE